MPTALPRRQALTGFRKPAKKKFVAGAVAAVALAAAGHARAADDVVVTKAAPAPSAYDWSGFYVGGHVAYDWGRGTSTLSNPNPTPVGDLFGSLYGGI